MIVCTSESDAGLCFVIPSEIGARRSPGDVLVFLIPCVIDGALLLYFLRGFRAPVSSVEWAGAPNAEPPSPLLVMRRSVAVVGHLVTESADG
jgi:hypothetical protein